MRVRIRATVNEEARPARRDDEDPVALPDVEHHDVQAPIGKGRQGRHGEHDDDGRRGASRRRQGASNEACEEGDGRERPPRTVRERPVASRTQADRGRLVRVPSRIDAALLWPRPVWPIRTAIGLMALTPNSEESLTTNGPSEEGHR